MSENTPPEISGYRFARRVAGSSTTDVWEAVQASMDRPVLAMVPSGDAAADPAAAARFAELARAFGRLRHPAFVPVVDV
ncbi:MAG: hypothetical protein IJ678_08055, partial [Kiritimatiellae bacterium]|nr:hypothetical protein [Kiritimatiellia bacterium]